MADRAAPNVGLCHLPHFDRGHDPGVHAHPFQAVLQHQRIDHGRHHTDVVGGRTLHALTGAADTPKNVAGTDDNGELDAETVDIADLSSDRVQHRGVDAVTGLAHEGFAA